MRISDTTPLYHKIAESIREDILYQKLLPGDRLPTVRELAGTWNCTPGTVHRAFRELTRQGLVESHSGKGTHVIQTIHPAQPTPLRQAQLVHHADSFLLEVLTGGYTPEEIETAFQLALDRWRALRDNPPLRKRLSLRFVGSHDPALSRIAPLFTDFSDDFQLEVAYAGSLGGLMALVNGEADIAGCHLWDQETNTYNVPFVMSLFPGRKMALLTLAHRHLGFITRPGNPHQLFTMRDLSKPGVRFANRQEGAGTRIWFDHQLTLNNISRSDIDGYGNTITTHSELARAVAENRVDVGLGVQAAASSYHLDFVPLTTERYEFILPESVFNSAGGSLQAWLQSDAVQKVLDSMSGYNLEQSGQIRWVT
ncbi:MAG: GntR family transcriptional regulator [Anaerolineales bacterium]|nr:GntR family transcriptional regulator [Anaerolineales bacterium]